MSEPDSTPRRRPPTIDLTAKEIDSGSSASAPESAGPEGAGERAASANRARTQARRNPFGVAIPYLIGGAGGVIVAGAVVAFVWLTGQASIRETATTPGQETAKAVANGESSPRLEKIQEAPRAMRPEEPRSVRLTEVEEKAKLLGDEFGALTRRVDDLAAASQTVSEQAKAVAAAAASARDAAASAQDAVAGAKDAAQNAKDAVQTAKDAVQGGVQRADLDALTARVTELSSTVQSLAANVAHHVSNADDRTARATVAAEALRAAVERGAPFTAELNAAKSLGADAEAVSALAPFAESGVPAAAALGRELSPLVPALQKAIGSESGDGSFLGRLEAHAQNLVRFTPIDASSVGPGDASSIARIAAAAARGDVAAALGGLESLPDKVRAPADDWIKKAKARETAISASRHIAADALAALSKPAAQ